MRSLLFVPADSARKLERALESGADCLLIDLEDSVASGAKRQARNQARSFLESCSRSKKSPRLCVRVNALDSGLIDEDLDAVMAAGPEAILLPKSVSGRDVQHLGAKLAVREAQNNLAEGATKIIALATETAASLFHLGSYAGASSRLMGLTWGAEDLSADIGAETSRLENGSYYAPYQLARTLTLLGASAARVLAIDTISPDFKDIRAFALECEAARRDGFTAKMAIHPSQVAVVNQIFTPDAAAIAKAKAVLQAFDNNPGLGVVSLDGQMFDRPHYERAKRILARASQ